MITAKLINFALQTVHKLANMVPVADGVVNLYGHGQHFFTVLLKGFAHGENGEQMVRTAEGINIKGSKRGPRQHRNIERIRGSSGLCRVMYLCGVCLHILLISFQKCVVIAVEGGIDGRKVFVFSIENGV